MRMRNVTVDERRTLVIVLDKGEDAVPAITEAVAGHGVHAASVTAVGGFQEAVVGYFDRDRRDYERIPVDGQVEVLSLVGDVADRAGDAVLHAHVVLGRRDGSTVGGHLLRGVAWPTLEVVVTEVADVLAKHEDPETGLALIDPTGAA